MISATKADTFCRLMNMTRESPDKFDWDKIQGRGYSKYKHNIYLWLGNIRKKTVDPTYQNERTLLPHMLSQLMDYFGAAPGSTDLNDNIDFFYNTILKVPDDNVYLEHKGVEIPLLYPTDQPVYSTRSNFKFELSAGGHDFLDQYICVLAEAAGYDSVILQREVGEYRVVTEIMDTRQDSYSHLYKVPLEKDSWLPIDKFHPTIWYTNYGLLNGEDLDHPVQV